MEYYLFLNPSRRVRSAAAQDPKDRAQPPEITENDSAEREEVPAEPALAADMQEEAAETQNAATTEAAVLSEQAEDYSESEAASTEWESDPESQDQAFAKRKACQEKAHARQKASLESQEKDLAAWETDLRSQDQATEQQESLRHAPAAEQPIQKVSAVDILKEMKELSSSTKALSGMITNWNEDGLKALCHLSQDMNTNPEEELRPSAGRLDQILENFFLAEAIEPRAGDAFDPSLHTRLSYSRTGRKVKACLAKGWRRGNITLAHAIVDTD